MKNRKSGKRPRVSFETPLRLVGRKKVSTETGLKVEPYGGGFEEVMSLLQMSMGMISLDGVRHLIAVERTRGTRYYAAVLGGEVVGLIGVWFDPTNATTALEPPQVIDFAVLPDYRRQGIGRVLMKAAVRYVQAGGQSRLWLYAGLDDQTGTIYNSLGFRLVSIIPDWFGDGAAKAIYRRDLSE
jgi:ribosomal protein S18 acetylase RimI-like enzyme